MPNGSNSVANVTRIFCGAIEEKMGIHANSTCQMNLDGATGWIIGEPNKGLNAMFVFMNAARFGRRYAIGRFDRSGVSKCACAYAKDRLQMRSLSGPKAPEKAGRSYHRPS